MFHVTRDGAKWHSQTEDIKPEQFDKQMCLSLKRETCNL